MIEASTYRKIGQKDSDASLHGTMARPSILPPARNGSDSSFLEVDSTIAAIRNESEIRSFSHKNSQNQACPTPAVTSHHDHSPYAVEDTLQRRWAVALFSITTVLLFADQK